MRLLSPGRKRVITFAAVGVTCFLVQFALLSIMVHLGTYRPAANAISFAISAQLNFPLGVVTGTCLVCLACNLLVVFRGVAEALR